MRWSALREHETCRINPQALHFHPLGFKLSSTFISTFLYLCKTFSSWLTQAGMLTVVMLSTVGSPTDFSLKNTKVLVLYADTFSPFSTMLTLSLDLYSLGKHNKKDKYIFYYHYISRVVPVTLPLFKICLQKQIKYNLIEEAEKQQIHFNRNSRRGLIFYFAKPYSLDCSLPGAV